jgi:hypothetical protein
MGTLQPALLLRAAGHGQDAMGAAYTPRVRASNTQQRARNHRPGRTRLSRQLDPQQPERRETREEAEWGQWASGTAGERTAE